MTDDAQGERKLAELVAQMRQREAETRRIVAELRRQAVLEGETKPEHAWTWTANIVEGLLGMELAATSAVQALSEENQELKARLHAIGLVARDAIAQLDALKAALR